MSLQSKQYKINNDLISLFAIMDSWCDKNASFLNDRTVYHLTPLETIKQVLVLAHLVLSIVNDLPRKSDEDIADFLKFLKDPEQDLSQLIFHNFISDDFRTSLTSKFGDDTETLRDNLRDQLFNLLCLLEKLHNSRLDAFSPDVSDQKFCVVNIIRALITNVSFRIAHHHEVFELTSDK